MQSVYKNAVVGLSNFYAVARRLRRLRPGPEAPASSTIRQEHVADGLHDAHRRSTYEQSVVSRAASRWPHSDGQIVPLRRSRARAVAQQESEDFPPHFAKLLVDEGVTSGAEPLVVEVRYRWLRDPATTLICSALCPLAVLSLPASDRARMPARSPASSIVRPPLAGTSRTSRIKLRMSSKISRPCRGPWRGCRRVGSATRSHVRK